MDLFSSPYYKVQKACLTICGAWPYQNDCNYLVIQKIFLTATLIFVLIPEVIVVVNQYKDFDTFMACLPFLSAAIMALVKSNPLYFNNNEVKILLEELQCNWEDFRNMKSEMSIIKSYANIGKQISIICVVATCYYLMSCIAPVLDLILPLNESRSRVLIFGGDFYGHTEEHFFLLLTMEFFGAICAGHLILTLDILYITLMFHSCGTFAVLCHRLQNIEMNNFKNQKYQLVGVNLAANQDQMIYHYLSTCIQLHIRNIKYGERINSLFNVAFFFDLLFGSLIACLSAVKFVISIKEPNQRVRYGFLYVTQSVRIFCNMLPGQLLIDHSSRVKLAASRSKWYDLSEKSKKLVLILIMRAEKPTRFVVGRLFVMNIELFSLITRTCLSYCTIILSVQKN
ncbi:odorant receptor 10-like isoform X2 [Prorops nasuta]|uniref:odorant receptor 10-like isoform X2 n=1 Tax=Prorops nasuta TaxID=863751 RepID=UPI0034CED188